MRLSNFTDYSLRALIYIGLKKNELSTVAEIAKSYGISQNHLVKVVHNLTKLGVLEGIKGRSGGVKLLIPADAINLGNIVRTLENDTKLVECFGEKDGCIITRSCKLKGILNKSQNAFYEVLEEYYLSDILSPQNSLREILGQ